MTFRKVSNLRPDDAVVLFGRTHVFVDRVEEIPQTDKRVLVVKHSAWGTEVTKHTLLADDLIEIVML